MSKTYKYVSLMEASRDTPPWDMDEGGRTIVFGKQLATWMSHLRREDDTVGRYRFERMALAELPEWMTAEDAIEWVREHQPDGFAEYFADEEVADNE